MRSAHDFRGFEQVSLQRFAGLLGIFFFDGPDNCRMPCFNEFDPSLFHQHVGVDEDVVAFDKAVDALIQP